MRYSIVIDSGALPTSLDDRREAGGGTMSTPAHLQINGSAYEYG
jgi:hypothetical protein